MFAKDLMALRKASYNPTTTKRKKIGLRKDPRRNHHGKTKPPNICPRCGRYFSHGPAAANHIKACLSKESNTL